MANTCLTYGRGCFPNVNQTHFVIWVEWKNKSSGASIHVGNCLMRPPDWPGSAPGPRAPPRLPRPARVLDWMRACGAGGTAPLLIVGEMAEDADGDSFAPGRSGASPPWLAKAETYSSGGRFGRIPGIGSGRLGMNGAPGVGVGLPASPRPRPGIGGNRGEFVAGLSRAALLNGGTENHVSNVRYSIKQRLRVYYLQMAGLPVASWCVRHHAAAKRLGRKSDCHLRL